MSAADLLKQYPGLKTVPKHSLDFYKFTDAVKEIPKWSSDPSKKDRPEYMEENVLANSMHECGLTIKDLVQSSYRQLSPISSDEFTTTQSSTAEQIIQRVQQ